MSHSVRFAVSQVLSRVVPVGVPLEVSNPAISPTISSLVSTTSRSKRPTSRVNPNPTDGGVRTSRTRAPAAEASRCSSASR